MEDSMVEDSIIKRSNSIVFSYDTAHRDGSVVIGI